MVKKRVLITGMIRRTVARPKRIFATNNSPAIAACARTGSGRDHREAKVLRKVGFIGSNNLGRSCSRPIHSGSAQESRCSTQSNLADRIKAEGRAGNRNRRAAHLEAKPFRPEHRALTTMLASSCRRANRRRGHADRHRIRNRRKATATRKARSLSRRPRKQRAAAPASSRGTSGTRLFLCRRRELRTRGDTLCRCIRR